MPRYFTYYWTNETCERQVRQGSENQPLGHIAGDAIRARKIGLNDFVYVVTVIKGELYLVGRMEIDIICSRAEAIRRLGTHNVYEKSNVHALAKRSTGTPERYGPGGRVPLEITESLRFKSVERPEFIFDRPGRLKDQTARTPRELTESSVQMLDQLIAERDPGHLTETPSIEDDERPTKGELETAKQDIQAYESEESYQEGKTSTTLVNHYERNPQLRAAAIRIHGTTCQVCGLSFGAIYGPHGEDYIEVHHLRPISSYDTIITVNPRTDMAVLCSNCHSMIHRNPGKPLTLEELRDMLRIIVQWPGHED